MAFIPPDEEKPGPQAQPAISQAPVAAGGAGVAGTKAAATPGQNIPAQPSAQLSAYLAANQPQAAQFGQDVAGKVSDQINAAGQSIPQAVNAYTGNLYNAPNNPNVDIFTPSQSAGVARSSSLSAPVGGSQPINSVVETNPSALSESQRNIYKQELGAAAAAPNSANTFETTSGYQDAAGKVQSAVDQANLWNSGNNPSNIGAALAPYEGPNATAGVRTLDSLLLSQTPQAYGAIQKAVAPAAGYQSQLASGTKDANAALQAAIAQDQAATTGAQGSAQKFAGNLTDYLNKSVADNQAARTAQLTANNNISAGLAGGALTEADAIALGIPADRAAAFADSYNKLNPAIASENDLFNSQNPLLPQSRLAPVNLSDFLTPGAAPDINASTVATPQNYSDIAALMQLMGTSAPTLPIDSSTANLAGTGLNSNASSIFNIPGANQAFNANTQGAAGMYKDVLGTAQTDSAQNIKNIVSYLNALSGNQTDPLAAVNASWLESQYPGLNVPPPQTPGSPDRYFPLGGPEAPAPAPAPSIGITDPGTGLPVYSNVGGDYFGTAPAPTTTPAAAPWTPPAPSAPPPIGSPEYLPWLLAQYPPSTTQYRTI